MLLQKGHALLKGHNFFSKPNSSKHGHIASRKHSRKGSRKKSNFFSGPATKAFTPPPLGLVAIRNFFPYIKKSSFFLSGRALTPPRLSGRTTKKKKTFFAASHSTYLITQCCSIRHIQPPPSCQGRN